MPSAAVTPTNTKLQAKPSTAAALGDCLVVLLPPAVLMQLEAQRYPDGQQPPPASAAHEAQPLAQEPVASAATVRPEPVTTFVVAVGGHEVV